jgi:SAM-dependent methyltransferase
MNATATTVSPVRRILRKGKHAAWLLSRQVNNAAAHLPLLAAKERVYDDAFYAHADEVHRPMYERLSDALYRHLSPGSAVDVGCGTGFLLAELAERGTDVRGIEGSRHAIERSRIGDRIVRANLERGVPNLGRFDIAICTEVAEHLPERSSAPLVQGLARMSDTVVFTAAVPGQGGTHHVNEQPHSFWEDLFAKQGLSRSPLTETLRDEIRDIPEPEWMRENLIVFQRNV